MSQTKIVRLTEDMLPQAAALEEKCFSSPWSVEALRLLVGERGVGFAALDGCNVVAYAGMLTVLDEGQITSVAVCPEYRRRGLGREIMNVLEQYSLESDIKFLSLEVRISNIAARRLYTVCGWREEGVRKRFYSFPTEDAVVMTKKLD